MRIPSHIGTQAGLTKPTACRCLPEPPHLDAIHLAIVTPLVVEAFTAPPTPAP